MAFEAIPLAVPLLENIDATALTAEHTATVENGYITESNGYSRFAGLTPFATVGLDRVYLYPWRGNLIAVTSGGRLYVVDKAGNATDLTEAAITGGKRPTFAETEDDLLIAAGGQIIRFDGNSTTILSATAPLSTHIGYVDGYVVALEPGSGRFEFSNAGFVDTWDPLNVFSANGKPDFVRSLFVTPRNELLMSSISSTEQFEVATDGNKPFFRRFLAGEGILGASVICFEDNAPWMVNQKSELIRLDGQRGVVKSFPIQRQLEMIDDWDGAWMARIPFVGQRYILLQIPNAPNAYGTMGITYLHDVRSGRFSQLYGWDPVRHIQTRWPGWSFAELWNDHFIGGEGGAIYKLDIAANTIAGLPMASVLRSGHIDAKGDQFRIDNVMIRFKRGVSSDDTKLLAVRLNKDNRGFGRWNEVKIGQYGDFPMVKQLGAWGCCYTAQWEIRITDAAPAEIVGMFWDRTML